MIFSRINSRVIFTGLALNLGAWLIVRLSAQFGLTPRMLIAESAIRTFSLCLAYFLALALNFEIAEEYRNTRWLHVAWLALAANAGVSIVRMLVESSLVNLFVSGYSGSPLQGLLQHIAIVPANAFLLLGLFAMWRAYQQVDLGFKIKRRDYLAIGGIFLLIIGLLAYREGLSEARSPYAAGKYLQLAGLVLLSLSAASSLILQRMAMQMGGGKLALALRWLTIYTLLRGVLVLVQAWGRIGLYPWPGSPGNIRQYLFEIGWQAIPWIAALAAAYRAELTVHAAKALEEHRAAKADLVSA